MRSCISRTSSCIYEKRIQQPSKHVSELNSIVIAHLLHADYYIVYYRCYITALQGFFLLWRCVHYVLCLFVPVLYYYAFICSKQINKIKYIKPHFLRLCQIYWPVALIKFAAGSVAQFLKLHIGRVGRGSSFLNPIQSNPYDRSEAYV